MSSTASWTCPNCHLGPVDNIGDKNCSECREDSNKRRVPEWGYLCERCGGGHKRPLPFCVEIANDEEVPPQQATWNLCGSCGLDIVRAVTEWDGAHERTNGETE
jgi:hypothetical protein